MAEPILIDNAGPPDEVMEKENRIMSGQPTAVIIHPNNGKRLPVYPKAQGYFYKIQEASNEYLIALATYESHAKATGLGRVWKFWWHWRRKRALDNIELTKYRMLALMLEDTYNAERHTELTVEDFASMPHDTVVELLAEYKAANDIDDILSKLIEDWDKKKASPEVGLVKDRAGLRV